MNYRYKKQTGKLGHMFNHIPLSRRWGYRARGDRKLNTVHGWNNNKRRKHRAPYQSLLSSFANAAALTAVRRVRPERYIILTHYDARRRRRRKKAAPWVTWRRVACVICNTCITRLHNLDRRLMKRLCSETLALFFPAWRPSS